MSKRYTSILLCLLLIAPPGSTALARVDAVQTASELIRKSYLELLEEKEVRKFPSGEIDGVQSGLKSEREAEEKRLKAEQVRIRKDLKAAREELDQLNKKASRDDSPTAQQRDELHCRVLRLEDDLSKARTQLEKGLPVVYQNRLAKLELIQKWPSIRAEIEREIEAGRARERRYGNVEDIGIRDLGIDDLAKKQNDDIKLGRDAIDEMKREKLMPPDVDDKEVTKYLQDIANDVARNSDLKVPIKVTFLDSMEINAFALPGGFLFINSGLVNKAESESELVGVLAHEIAHDAARHGARLTKRAQIANIVFQAAQIGAIIFTGGAAGIGTYYALQYGFYGLGMVLDLTLLGVSREYEAEADQLGAQYAWQAGYDPRGFITFFDKMASEEGYVRSASFFRTHPPFLERIISTFSEITYLPAKKELRMDSSSFQDAKKRMSELTRKRETEDKNKPSLRGKSCK
jgi:hypothetical protein